MSGRASDFIVLSQESIEKGRCVNMDKRDRSGRDRSHEKSRKKGYKSPLRKMEREERLANSMIKFDPELAKVNEVLDYASRSLSLISELISQEVDIIKLIRMRVTQEELERELYIANRDFVRIQSRLADESLTG